MPKWYDLAKAEKGVKEAPGAADNKTVLQYYKDAGHPQIKHDSVAWCAAFANAMLKRAKIEGTGKLTARSFLKWGVKMDKPVEGCIVVFKRGNSSWQGHVAFYISETSTHVQVLGGNQSDAVNVRAYPKSKLLGYRWPEGVPIDGKAEDKGVAILENGSTGWRVKALQERLTALGYHPGEADGHFGDETEDAVATFQHREGLKVDGEVGSNTQAALDTAEPRKRTARAEDTVKDLKDRGSRIATTGDKIAKTGGAAAVAGGGAKGADEMGWLEWSSTVIESGKEAVTQGEGFRSFMDTGIDLLQWALSVWWAVIPVVGVALWYWAKQNQHARLEDHRTGRTK